MRTIEALVVLLLFLSVIGGIGCLQPEKPAEKQSVTPVEPKQKAKISEEDKYGGTLRIAIGTDPKRLDPAFSTDTVTGRIVQQIFNGLVQFKPGTTEIIPDLAESWEISEDGKVYTFKIRRGVKFHNGREVTAHDFEYSFKRVMDPKTASPRANFYEEVEEVKAVDDYTFQIKLKRPFAPFISKLAYSCFFVVPREEVERLGDAGFGEHPVGTGPFILKEWRHDDRLVLVANQEYYAGRPYLDKIVVRVIPEPQTALLEFENGNLDLTGIPVAEWNRITHRSKWKDYVISSPTLNVFYIGLHCQKEPFKDVRVRQALSYVLDPGVIVDTILKGRAVRATGVLPPGMPCYKERPVPYPRNPEKARQLLKEAGYPEGLEFTLTSYESPDQQQFNEVYLEQLKNTGFKMIIEQRDFGTLTELVDKGDVEAYTLGWIADYPDPENFLQVLLHSKNWGPAGNGVRYKNEEVDRLLEQAVLETDMDKRCDLYQKAEDIIISEAPWIFTWHRIDSLVHQPWVHGIHLGPMGFNQERLNTIWLDPDHRE